jgi:hypothetical protein
MLDSPSYGALRIKADQGEEGARKLMENFNCLCEKLHIRTTYKQHTYTK